MDRGMCLNAGTLPLFPPCVHGALPHLLMALKYPFVQVVV